MKFGLFINAQQPRGDDPVLRFRQCVQQVIVARDTGFDAIASGHHYVSPPYIALQNLPFLARLAADSGTMRATSHRSQRRTIRNTATGAQSEEPG